ncbi:ankyrin repeat and IBR domain-containing protein 1-like isoform X2 [Tubulanus polymorphus]|uniref:ankyrin repeat and IBR domain-containing protein 1-like isoform X2 n=1 Tax=Tubulanus polymorphus TaxID=672921 RepID=UPI003DA2A8EC
MGSSSSKFRKHLQNGDEYAALQLYSNNSDLRKGLDPNLSYGESHSHETALHYAAKHAMKSLLRIFLYELGGNPNKKNARNESALHCVCMVSNHRPYTALSFTILQRRLECLTLILQWRGAVLKDGELEKVDIAAQDEKLNTALHYAAASGLRRCVELLVAHSCPLFMENAQRQTPCDCAEKCSHNAIAVYLESKMVFSNEGNTETEEDLQTVMQAIQDSEAYSGLRAQDLQESKDQLLVETSDMLRVPLFTAEALLRNHEWSREMLLEAWMEDPIECCNKCGVTPPASVHQELKPTDSHTIRTATTSAAASRLENSSSRWQTQIDVICDICACLIPGNEDEVPMTCDHQFCRDCWQRYLHVKIQEGEAHNITCPAYQCSKLVPVEIIENLVSRDMARRYLQFDIKAFVESNPNIKWCPYPGCGRAVRLPESEVVSPTVATARQRINLHDTSHAVDCGNGHYFCWECLGEAHEPASCENWKLWFEKAAEIKPEELNNTEVETELAANFLWLVTNSKGCPNCKSPIQKNEGCNHMKCSKCKHDFCWVCLEAWKKHSSATGGYFRCNRYEVVKKVEESTDGLKAEAEERNKKMQELNRFMHYYTRFKNHEHSFKLEEPLLSTAKEKMMILARAVTDQETANDETKFVEDAVHQLLRGRRVLKCSYVYGYYLDDSGYKRTIFEFMQTELEECLENLSQMVARPYLRTPRGRIIQQSHLVQRKRHEFVTAINKGLIPPDSSPNFRKKRRKTLDDDLRKALMASMSDIDPNNPWVKDKAGRHTNVAALLDWPDDDTDESDAESSPKNTCKESGICCRHNCKRTRAVNPRTGTIHNHCSLRCMRLDKLENRNESDDSDSGEVITDYQMDLLRALEMSRLQYLREMGGVTGQPSNKPSCSSNNIQESHEECANKETIDDDETAENEENSLHLEEIDLDLQRAIELSRISAQEEEKQLKLAIQLSLQNDSTEEGCSGKSELQSSGNGSSGSSSNTDQQQQQQQQLRKTSEPSRNIPDCYYSSCYSTIVTKVPNKSVEDLNDEDYERRSPDTGGDKLLGAVGGAPVCNFDPSPSHRPSVCEPPPGLLETTFTPSRLGSSQFGPIKDLAVTNIASSDRDKTEEFKTKKFKELFTKKGGEHHHRTADSKTTKESTTDIKFDATKLDRLVIETEYHLRPNQKSPTTSTGQRSPISPCQRSPRASSCAAEQSQSNQLFVRRHKTSSSDSSAKIRRRHSSGPSDEKRSSRQKTSRAVRYSDQIDSSSGATRKHSRPREKKCYSYTGTETSSDVWIPRIDVDITPPTTTTSCQSNLETMLKKLIIPSEDEDTNDDVFSDSNERPVNSKRDKKKNGDDSSEDDENKTTSSAVYV